MGAQLGAYRVEANEKSKKGLLGLVAGNTTTLLSAILGQWAEYTKQSLKEQEIRKEYEDEITEVQRQLMDYKTKQLKSVKGILMRNAAGSKEAMILSCYLAIKQEHTDLFTDEESTRKQKEMEEQLKNFASEKTKNATKVLQRMNAGTEEQI